MVVYNKHISCFYVKPPPGPRCVARVMVGNFLYSVAFSQCQSILFPIFPATSSCALKKKFSLQDWKILAGGKSSGRLSTCPCNLMPRRLNEVGCEKQKASLVQYAWIPVGNDVKALMQPWCQQIFTSWDVFLAASISYSHHVFSFPNWSSLLLFLFLHFIARKVDSKGD